MPFRKQITVPDYACDSNGRLKLSMAMRYMQSTSGAQLDMLGYSYERLYGENLVFLLSQTCVKIIEMPREGQKITVGTAATGKKGVRFLRDFTIEDEAGEKLLEAHTLWVLVDPESRRILRPSVFTYEIPMEKTLLSEEVQALVIPKVEEELLKDSWDLRVGYSLIDVNQHINNSVYADFVCDSLPMEALMEQGLDSMVISFQNEARHGENLTIQSAEMSKKEYYVRGGKGAGSSCFEAFAVLK